MGKIGAMKSMQEESKTKQLKKETKILNSKESIYRLRVLSRFSCVWLCEPWTRGVPGSFVRAILQTRTLDGLSCLLQGISTTQRSNPCLLHLLHWQEGSSLAPARGWGWGSSYLDDVGSNTLRKKYAVFTLTISLSLFFFLQFSFTLLNGELSLIHAWDWSSEFFKFISKMTKFTLKLPNFHIHVSQFQNRIAASIAEAVLVMVVKCSKKSIFSGITKHLFHAFQSNLLKQHVKCTKDYVSIYKHIFAMS